MFPDIPLTDLHRHLDGNIRPQTIWELAKKNHISIAATSLDALVADCQIQDKTPDLLSFLTKLDYGVSVLKHYEDCFRIAKENVIDAKKEGLHYAELRFSPYYMAQSHNLHIEGVVEAVIAGTKAGQQETGLTVNLIGILSRTYGVAQCQRELDGLLRYRDDIIGLDLAGDEKHFPARDFVRHFEQAKAVNWNVTVHAGEAAGPESIWDAINLLGAQRIGHGIAAVQDPELLEALCEREIGLEVCLTSNYHTTTVSDLAQHPLARFIDAGVSVSLNTDDPGVSANTIHDEYAIAQHTLGLTQKQLMQIQRNGLTQAFVSQAERQAIINAI